MAEIEDRGKGIIEDAVNRTKDLMNSIRDLTDIGELKETIEKLVSVTKSIVTEIGKIDDILDQANEILKAVEELEKGAIAVKDTAEHLKNWLNQSK